MPLLRLLLLSLLTATAGAQPADENELRQRLAERLAKQPPPEPLKRPQRGGAAPAPKPPPPRPWGYTGDGAPEHWGELSPGYKLCAVGTRQSPIDLRDSLRVDMDAIAFDYKPGGFSIIDTGRTVEVRPAAGNRLRVGQRQFELRHLQFHRPGEFRLQGSAVAMSIHLMHQDEKGRWAVLALLVQPGEADHAVIQRLWGAIPLERQQLDRVPAGLDLNGLLPEARGYFSFIGSLTTPPCTEDVLWLVMREPVRLSAQQIEVFARLYPMNARPLQPAGGRIVKESL
jgi:carbonic anhydrase